MKLLLRVALFVFVLVGTSATGASAQIEPGLLEGLCLCVEGSA